VIFYDKTRHEPSDFRKLRPFKFVPFFCDNEVLNITLNNLRKSIFIQCVFALFFPIHKAHGIPIRNREPREKPLQYKKDNERPLRIQRHFRRTSLKRLKFGTLPKRYIAVKSVKKIFFLFLQRLQLLPIHIGR